MGRTHSYKHYYDCNGNDPKCAACRESGVTAKEPACFDVHELTQKARFDRLCSFVHIEINEYARKEVDVEMERCIEIIKDSESALIADVITEIRKGRDVEARCPKTTG